MATLAEAAREFLSCRRIAVAGLSRKGDTAANGIYRRLRKAGYTVFPLNPFAASLEGDPCHARLADIPGGVEAVIIATHPRDSAAVARDCAAAGVKRVWMHGGMGRGSSVSREAVRLCREAGVAVIPGGCPVMFCEPVDPFHRCGRWWLRIVGRQARPQGFPIPP